jgi:hypothetical protein
MGLVIYWEREPSMMFLIGVMFLHDPNYNQRTHNRVHFSITPQVACAIPSIALCRKYPSEALLTVPDG